MLEKNQLAMRYTYEDYPHTLHLKRNKICGRDTRFYVYDETQTGAVINNNIKAIYFYKNKSNVLYMNWLESTKAKAQDLKKTMLQIPTSECTCKVLN